MKNLFKHPIEGNLFMRLWYRYWNWRIDKLFACKFCRDGDVINLHGYLECRKCGHKYL
jgi:hypothetical protein